MNGLKPLEKITQFWGENNENEDTWYEEINDTQGFLNPYYVVVELEKSKRYPLPFFFEGRTWELLGYSRDTRDGEFVDLKDKFPSWVIEWVNLWSRPNNGNIWEGDFCTNPETGEKFRIEILMPSSPG